MARQFLTALIFAISLITAVARDSSAQYQVLHHFDGMNGRAPIGALTFSDGMLYGLAGYGEQEPDWKNSLVFRLNADGSDYQVLHRLSPDALTEGRAVMGGLLVDETSLYGVTYFGGNDNLGTVFSVNTDGTGYTQVHHFSGLSGQPSGQLVSYGDRLYGMSTFYGGSVYSLRKDGSDFQIVHQFQAGTVDGSFPVGSLAVADGVLYGATTGSYSDGGFGTVFKVNVDGNNFQKLHQFNQNDGNDPRGTVVVLGDRVFGTTRGGGLSGAGVVYSVGIDGTGFQVLHNFLQDNSSDGYSPYTGLSSDGEALFGATLYGPFGSGGGTLFDINTDGSGYAKLKEFYSVQGPNEDGYAPSGELLVIGDTIYGLNGSGGRYGYGVVYALTITEPSTLWLFVTAIAFVSAIKIRARIQAISVNEQQLIQL